jgi:hypothetical protein
MNYPDPDARYVIDRATIRMPYVANARAHRPALPRPRQHPGGRGATRPTRPTVPERWASR